MPREIRYCRDLDQLEVWARRALTVERAEDLFSG